MNDKQVKGMYIPVHSYYNMFLLSMRIACFSFKPPEDLHEIGNAFMVGHGNTSTFLMVGSSGRGIWQGQGQLEQHPRQLVWGVVRHCGKQLGFLWVIHSLSPPHCSVYVCGWPGTFLGKEVIKIDVTSHSHIRGERGHDCIFFLAVLEPFCTRLHVVCEHQ